MDEVSPEKEIRIKSRTEPWINEEILEVIRERDRALIQSNQNKTDRQLRKKYTDLRNKVITQVRETKANYFTNEVELNKDNPKKLWKQFKTLGYSNKNKAKNRIVLEIDNKKCFNPKEVVNTICKYFLTIASKLVGKIINTGANMYKTTGNLLKDYYLYKGVIPKSHKLSKVTEEFVYKELCSLNPSKSTGIDEIKPKFLRDGADIIKGSVTHIINLSITTNTVPEELKFAIVKPLYKKNSRLEVGNYRPVSILCTISKILERAIQIQLVNYLEKFQLLYEFQSGFRKSYSTDTCLINLMDHIRMLVSKKKFVGMVLLDLQKAFDTVDHEILCQKLEIMGLDYTQWMKSYLGGRKQVVMANDTVSEPGIVSCGVPQGSILGPLLFLCYINDMPISVNCKLLLYADDSALIVSGTDPENIAELLTKELESCKQWLNDNKLSLHLGKTESILFGSKRNLRKVENFPVKCENKSVKHVNSVKYLGVQLDNDLCGKSIVNNVITKTNSRLKFLYKYRELLSFKSRKLFFQL